MNDIMLDIESLSTKAYPVVTQIGACYFDRHTAEIGDKFKVNIQIQDQLNKGLNINGDTLKWWLERSNNITWLENPVFLNTATTSLREFIYKNKKAKIWSHSSFDIRMLSYLYEIIKEKYPWNYRNIRDIRTLTDLASINYQKETNSDPKTHDALDDCLYQVKYCVECFNKLEVNNEFINN